MSLILSGTDGLSDVDGSAATPALRGTDANTGIFFPAADTIAFSEGGVEAMRINSTGQVKLATGALQVFGALDAGQLSAGVMDWQSSSNNTRFLSYGPSATSGGFSWTTVVGGGAGTQAMTLDSSGNLGLGVTPSAWSSTWKVFQSLGGFVGSNSADGYRFANNSYSDGTNWRYVATGEASAYQQLDGSHAWFNAASGTAGNTISFTQAMTLDTSGRLLVGCTSGAQGRLAISGSGGTTGSGDVVLDSNASYSELQSYNNRPLYINRQGNNVIVAAESGNLLVGTTSAYGTIASTGSIAPAATPSISWGIDFASSVTPPNYVSFAASATYDLAAGSGIVVIHNNTNGEAAIFITYAGATVKLGGAASVIAGTGGANEIGLTYNGGAGKYRINNGYGTTQFLYITTIRTRTAS